MLAVRVPSTPSGPMHPKRAVRSFSCGGDMLDPTSVRDAWRRGRDPSLRWRRAIAALASAGLVVPLALRDVREHLRERRLGRR
jgi:hypothetical protein